MSATKPLAAVLLLAGGLAAFEAYLAFDGSTAPMTVAFIALAAACLAGAIWLIRVASKDPTQPGPLFGRNASGQRPTAPLGAPALIMLPVVVLAAAVASHSGIWNAPTDIPSIASTPPVEPQIATPDAIDAPVPAPSEAPASPPVTKAELPKPDPLPTDARGHSDAVIWLDLATDGHSLLSASSDHSIKLWDIESKRLVSTLGTHKDIVRTALFMPDQSRAITAGDDAEIVLRSLTNGSVLHIFAASEAGAVRNLAISADGRRAVSGHDTGAVIVWDVEKGAVLHVLIGHQWSVSAVAVDPTGNRALSSSIDGELRLWDLNTGTLLRRWQGHDRGAYGAAFTADGRQAVTGSGDYTIKLWDVETAREVRRYSGHSGTVYAIALSKDDKQILSGSLDGSARLWDTETGDQIAMFDPGSGAIYSVAFGNDGSVLTGGVDRTIRRWRADSGSGSILFAGAQ